MNDVERAVERLTENHSEIVGDQAGVCEPLLLMLWEARYPSLGKGSSSGGGEGSMLNQQALSIYEHIDGVVRAWLTHYREHATGDLIPLVKRLHQVLLTEDAGGRLEDRDRMYGMFQQFVTQIETCFDPPPEKELMGACPGCEATHSEGENGEQRRAVRMIVNPGHALVAECHACGKLWAGQDALTELAESMGAVIDRVALREMLESPKAKPAEATKIR